MGKRSGRKPRGGGDGGGGGKTGASSSGNGKGAKPSGGKAGAGSSGNGKGAKPSGDRGKSSGSNESRFLGANSHGGGGGRVKTQNPDASSCGEGTEKIGDQASFTGGGDHGTPYRPYYKKKLSDWEESSTNRGRFSRHNLGESSSYGGEYDAAKFGESFCTRGKLGVLQLEADSSGGIDPADRQFLYKILGVNSSASQQEIRTAYHKMALRLHPDKNPGDEGAKGRFQLLQKVISILGEMKKRAKYDQTGYIGITSFIGESPRSFMESCKLVFKKVIEEEMKEFEKNYKDSPSEKNDLMLLYKMSEGDIDSIYPMMLFAKPYEDSRLRSIFDGAIHEGLLETTKHYEKWVERISGKEASIPSNDVKNKKDPEEYVGEVFSGRTFVKIKGVMKDSHSNKYMGFLSASHAKDSLKVVDCYARVYESKTHAKAYYELMRICNHDNILHATDYAENEEAAVITFEPVEETLESYIIRKNKSLCTPRKSGHIVEFTEDLRNKTKCIIAGLAYLHRKKIWHGDLRLSEIYVTKAGVIKLALMEREFDGKHGRYSITADVNSMGPLYEQIVGIVNKPSVQHRYWRQHMEDFYWKIKNGRYKSATDLLSHTVLYSRLQKEYLLINAHGTSNLRSEQSGVGREYNEFSSTLWRAHFHEEIAVLKEEDNNYTDDLYPTYKRFCRNTIIHLDEQKSHQTKALLESKESALRAFEAYYPPLLYELADFLKKENKLSEFVHF